MFHVAHLGLFASENGESAHLTRLNTRNRHPLANRQLVLPRWSRHDDQPSGPHEMSSEPEEVANIASAPRDDRIESSGNLPNDILESRPHDLCFDEGQLTDRRRQERHPPLPRLHHRQPHPWIDNLERYPGNAGPGPRVQNIPRFRGQDATKQEAIEKNSLDDPPRFGGTQKPMGRLPFSQYI